MTLYTIIRCPKCNNFIAVREGSKSFTCPYCGTKSKLIDRDGKPILKIYKVVEGREVPRVLAALKSRGEIEDDIGSL